MKEILMIDCNERSRITCAAGMNDHQNNSFDELSEGGYSHAHHEELPPRSGRSVGSFSFFISAGPKQDTTNSTILRPALVCRLGGALIVDV
jgi:hypothetical protein